MLKRFVLAVLILLALTTSAQALSRRQAANVLRHARITYSFWRGPFAARAGCFGSSWAEYDWHGLGKTIAWVRVFQDGWCGNGRRITRDLGWGHATWAWGIYCMTNVSSHVGWDVYPRWKHGGTWATAGVSYPWGCGGLRGGHATVRIAGNGYWDAYNDFSF